MYIYIFFFEHIINNILSHVLDTGHTNECTTPNTDSTDLVKPVECVRSTPIGPL